MQAAQRTAEGEALPQAITEPEIAQWRQGAVHLGPRIGVVDHLEIAPAASAREGADPGQQVGHIGRIEVLGGVEPEAIHPQIHQGADVLAQPLAYCWPLLVEVR